jgi:hypothetical protein
MKDSVLLQETAFSDLKCIRRKAKRVEMRERKGAKGGGWGGENGSKNQTGNVRSFDVMPTKIGTAIHIAKTRG